jgi:hypothetical protein
MAIGNPTAAEVPMACWTRTLHQVRKGTVSDPPPMATSAETAPMPLPTAKTPTAPGSRAPLGLQVEDHLRSHQADENE